jgi:hypothetical protein
MEPCSIFQDASKQERAWIVQTTSPLEKRYKEWAKQCNADIFVFDYFSINEMTALGWVLAASMRFLLAEPSPIATYVVSRKLISNAITKSGDLRRVPACCYQMNPE